VISRLASTGIARSRRNFGQKRNVQTKLMSQLTGFFFMVAIGMATLSIWAQEASSPASVLTLTILRYRWLKVCCT